MSQPTVAIVLTGAAARGAFQAGAPSRIAPALERQGLRPSIYLGTSAGAINAALWGRTHICRPRWLLSECSPCGAAWTARMCTPIPRCL